MSLSFLEFVELLQCIDEYFSLNLGSSGPLFFQIFSVLFACSRSRARCPPLPRLLLDPVLCVFVCSVVSHSSAHFSSFCFCSVAQTGWADLLSGLLILPSPCSDLLVSAQDFLGISYCTFQLQNFCSVLFVSSVSLLIVLIW